MTVCYRPVSNRLSKTQDAPSSSRTRDLAVAPSAIVNATIVDADVEYDNFSLAEQFVLTGLSDSPNVIAF